MTAILSLSYLLNTFTNFRDSFKDTHGLDVDLSLSISVQLKIYGFQLHDILPYIWKRCHKHSLPQGTWQPPETNRTMWPRKSWDGFQLCRAKLGLSLTLLPLLVSEFQIFSSTEKVSQSERFHLFQQKNKRSPDIKQNIVFRSM